MRPRASIGPNRGSLATTGRGERLKAWLATGWGRATIPGLIGLVLLSGYVLWTLRDLPSPGQQDGLANTITIFDRKGRVIEERNAQGQYHKVMTLKQMGGYGPAATLAAEDRSFYHEGAINWISTFRAAFIDLTSGQVQEGGSTITQQLVKIQLLTPQRSILRKVQEAILATGMEVRYSKDQVLEMYLNRVYYGHNAYGLGAAAEVYFSKEPKDLSPAQAAFLAGLIPAPVAYDPQTHFDLARERQLYVLHGMVATGALSSAAEKTAEAENIQSELKYNSAARQSKAPHFVDYVIGKLEQDYGAAAVQQGGFNVYTTLDLDLQQLANQSVQQGVQDLSAYNVNNADFLAVKPDTGEVLAWVGSADYYNDQIGGQYDVVLSPRQPGSSFKPYVYESAFKDRVLTPGSYVDDTPQTFGGNFKPTDFDGKYLGRITARKALVMSRNIPAVETGVKDGMTNVDNLAQAAGITSPLDPVPDTAIGGSAITLYEHIQGFATFANQGTKEPLISITKITDTRGNLLSETTPGSQDGKEIVMTPAEAYLITDILKGYQNQWHFGWNKQMAAKTGTTGATSNQTRDAWILAYNSDIVAGTWAGNTQANGGGGQINAYGELLGDTIMKYFVNGLPAQYNNFIQRPDGIVDGTACDGTKDIFLTGTQNLACNKPSPSPSATTPSATTPSPTNTPAPVTPLPTTTPTAVPTILPASPTPNPSPTASP
ncbi:MAG TPA: transglycosylase domain-containing protein [Candidatus Dormibacteraeota bacterium]|nr:transglycosylase domain-containing protein [Candidatus Dormibacteraeota bacterium]